MEIHVNGQTMSSTTGSADKSVLPANLIHVSDSQPGITRVRRGKGFVYYNGGKKVSGKKQLARIRRLVIPPAWENVWICPEANGHLQATGYDAKSRKQYLYHPAWIALRGETKFHRLNAFGAALPAIRKQVQKDLSLKGLPKEKVLAATISLLERTNIRIGNELYERLYGSLGLSTLKDSNVKLHGSGIRFIFTGKKGVDHDITIRNKKLALIVHHCREIPGKRLFQYYDEDGQRRPIFSDEINDYIKQLSGGHFTSKDFRTWFGTVECLRAFRLMDPCDHREQLKKNVAHAIAHVAHCLGNTQRVSKLYYIHPLIISSYERGKLKAYFDKFSHGSKWMDREERLLMKLLSLKRR